MWCLSIKSVKLWNSCTGQDNSRDVPQFHTLFKHTQKNDH